MAVLTGLVGAVATAAASTGALFFMFWELRNASSISSPVSPTILGIGALVAAPIVGTLVTMIAVGAGVAMTWVGVLLPLQPVELHEVKAMADEHNQKLEGASGGGFTPPPATIPAETRT